MEFKDALLGTWTMIINTSLLSGSFLQPFKKATVIPLIKSYKLDMEIKTIDLSVIYLLSHRQLKELLLCNFLHTS